MKPRRRHIRLQDRIASWTYMMSVRSEDKVETRKKTGGFKCPGSRNR